MKLKRALIRGLAVCLALTAVTATVQQQAIAAGGPSVNAPDVNSVPVTNSVFAARGQDDASARALQGNQPQAGSQEGGGSFAATPFSQSASWEVSKQSGDFNWSYPLRVPPSPGGFNPALGLSYRSSAVDGLTSATNNQPSWIGDGWDLSAGFVERAYGSCADDTTGGTTPPKTGDLCWRSDNATASFGGSGGMLVKDDATGTWRLKQDDRSRVERTVTAGNGDKFNESWKITTVDGTQYLFGTRPDSKSTWTVPVFGDDAGEPCHESTFEASSCDRAWRWMLDKVIDPRGNVILYNYDTEINKYGKNLKEAAVPYVRAGTLKSVEYGLRDDVNAPATGRVEFGLADRCVKDSECTFAKKENWPDAAVAENCDGTTCKDKYSPTFWSTKRLSTITTQVRVGDGYQNVDRWTLQHEFPKGDDVYQAALWLKGITHTGLVGGEISLPQVKFEGTAKPNRVDTPTGIGPLNRYRVTGVVSEAGGTTTIKYAEPDCVPGTSMPANQETNGKRCYPVKWAPKDGADREDYFHKYVVESITTSDRVAASSDQIVKYEYLDGAAWRRNQSEFVKDEKRTYNEFRGYGRVRVKAGHEGNPEQPVTMTEERFYRGMNGDKLPNNGTRVAKVKDSEGGEREDSDWLSGLSFETQVHDGTGETVTSKTISTPTWAGPTATRGDYKAYWVANASTTSYTALRSGGWRTTKTESKYDDHGQLTETNDLGDLATAADDRCTRTSYRQDAAKWIWSSPLQSETVSVHCGVTPTFPQHALGASKNTYDDAGNVTSVATLDSRPAAGPVFGTVVTTTYDKYGRALTSTDPLGNAVRTEYTPETGGPVTKVVVKDQLGHATTTEVNPAWGVGTKLTDPNENVTEGAYDALGRTVRVWQANRPRDEYPDDPNVKVDYDVSQDKPSSVRTTTVNAAGEYVSGTVVFDGQYRTRQAQNATSGGRLVVDTKYDSQGRVSRTTQPFFNASPVDTNLLSFSETEVPGLTRTAFDGSGRPTASIFQAGGQEKWRSSTAYGGDRVDVTPPAGGTPTTSVTDARGQMTELWQYKGATASGDHDVTKYGYSAAGKLATTTDAVGNTWRWHHDLRGRLVKSEDVDRGVTEMTYDTANRLTTTKDARGTVLTHEYDAAGRRTAIKSGATVLAKFDFDTAEYGKGLPAASTRYVNGKAYVNRVLSYTALNKPLAAEVEIPDSEGPLKGVYKRWFTYSPDGTVKSEGLGAVPAANMPNESVVHGVDELGRPRNTTASLDGQVFDNLVNTTAYTKLGELYRLELGNTGKRTWLSYYYDDSTRRMNRYIVDAEVASPMQADVNYAYDQIGNITSVADTTLGQVPDRQCFQYDYLRRLTEAWTPSGGCDAAKSTGSLAGPAPYWHSYTYDQVGNRRTETQHAASGDTTKTYDYPATGSPRPHAANSVTTTGPGGSRLDQFTYNEIGATTSRKVNGGDQTLEWDAEGRVTKLTEGAKVSEFLYSATGERLIRRDAAATTLYLGDEEIRLAKGATAPTVTRYYRHGGQVVAMREGKTKITWLASDMQGTAHVAIDRATMKVDRRRQLPFGAPRGTATTFPGERGFVGGTNDTTTGLVNIGARQYDAALGKFISVDPLMMPLDPQQWNAYAYANNSPITFSDPTGLAYCDYNVCAGDPGYKDNGQRNNKDGKCVAYCGNPHNAPPPSKPKSTPASPKMCTASSGYGSAPCGSGNTGGKYGHTSSGYPACTGCGQKGSAAFAHLVLDGLGMVPVIGEAADLTNCAAYAGEGKTTDAVLSCAGAVPFLGWGATIFKWVRNADHVKDSGRGVEQAVEAGAKCVNSFSGDTQVLMADGSTKRIDEIEVGDEVAASQPESDKVEKQTVVAVIITDEDKSYVDLTVSTPEGPKVIRSTAHHPFYNATTGKWEDAGELEAGDLLNTPGNGRAELVDTRLYASFMRTYNLSVDVVHTYFVVAGETPVLVHNTGPSAWCTDAMRLDEAPDIATGHANKKHGNEFPGVTEKELVKIAQDTVRNPARQKDLGGDRKAFLNRDGSTIVIHDPHHADGGTIFRRDPDTLDDYWDGLS